MDHKATQKHVEIQLNKKFKVERNVEIAKLKFLQIVWTSECKVLNEHERKSKSNVAN